MILHLPRYVSNHLCEAHKIYLQKVEVSVVVFGESGLRFDPVHGMVGVEEELREPGEPQVWSLTQFYSVDF